MVDAAVAPSSIEDGTKFDVAVLGSGAAGFSAAINAAIAGARVVLIESTAYVGGSTAYSAGTTWIPNTLHSARLGVEDSFENASGFLDRAVSNRSSRSQRDTFLKEGPRAIAQLEEKTCVKFRARVFHPDYLYELEGSMSAGRALEPLPFEAAQLGADFGLVRPPIPELTILGGLMIDRDDIDHLLKMTKSMKSFWHSFKLIARHGRDRLRHPRGTRLLMGNALVARMLFEARKRGVVILTQAHVTGLVVTDGAVTGLSISQSGVSRTLEVAGGVVLATGGFAQHPEKRALFFPSPAPKFSPSAPGLTGKMHDMVLAMGAHYGHNNLQNAFFAPVSVRKRKDGTNAVFPHFLLDRTKPGVITVNRHGRRFVNETTSYHLFVDAMYAANADGSAIPAYLVTDSVGLRKYGLGMVRPGGKGLSPFLADGYLVRGDTLAALAKVLGIDPEGLADSVARNNDFARSGVDLDFARGTTVYERANGDASHGPNPTIGKIDKGPFYAVQLWPGDIGSSMGLVADDQARILGSGGVPIPGLYVAGNDMQSIMGGTYPGPGITLGPAITFGFIAGTHAAKRARLSRRTRVHTPLRPLRGTNRIASVVGDRSR